MQKEKVSFEKPIEIDDVTYSLWFKEVPKETLEE